MSHWSLFRYGALVESAHDRRNRLHEAMILTEDWGQLSATFKNWLETTERTLQQLGKIPTDEEKLHQQIEVHQVFFFAVRALFY